MISKEDILNPRALVIDRGEVINAPGGNLPPPLEPMVAVPDEWMNRLREQDAAEKEKRQRQYEMEVESADRLRRAQEADQYWNRGIRPPDFLSEFRPPSSAQLQMDRPRFQNVGGRLYDVTTGVPSMVVDRAEPLARPGQIITDQAPDMPPAEGYQWIRGATGWQMQKKPTESISDLFNRISGAQPPSQPPASKQAMGGYTIGKTYRGLKYNGGDPLDERNWSK